MPHSAWIAPVLIVILLCSSIVGIAAKDWRTNAIALGVAVLALLSYVLGR
jgi:hypothetical protein